MKVIKNTTINSYLLKQLYFVYIIPLDTDMTDRLSSLRSGDLLEKDQEHR